MQIANMSNGFVAVTDENRELIEASQAIQELFHKYKGLDIIAAVVDPNGKSVHVNNSSVVSTMIAITNIVKHTAQTLGVDADDILDDVRLALDGGGK